MVSNQGCLLAGNLAVRLGNLTYQSYTRNKYYTANKYITYKLLSGYSNVIMTNNFKCFLLKNLQVPELNMNSLNTHYQLICILHRYHTTTQHKHIHFSEHKITFG